MASLAGLGPGESQIVGQRKPRVVLQQIRCTDQLLIAFVELDESRIVGQILNDRNRSVLQNRSDALGRNCRHQPADVASQTADRDYQRRRTGIAQNVRLVRIGGEDDAVDSLGFCYEIQKQVAIRIAEDQNIQSRAPRACGKEIRRILSRRRAGIERGNVDGQPEVREPLSRDLEGPLAILHKTERLLRIRQETQALRHNEILTGQANQVVLQQLERLPEDPELDEILLVLAGGEIPRIDDHPALRRYAIEDRGPFLDASELAAGTAAGPQRPQFVSGQEYRHLGATASLRTRPLRFGRTR